MAAGAALLTRPLESRKSVEVGAANFFNTDILALDRTGTPFKFKKNLNNREFYISARNKTAA
ncbi:MAG TPA: hypothetical protein VEH02_04935 [Pseudolabrys sp.]|nr:hypothetical protein [Pseudolabrys sp.]